MRILMILNNAQWETPHYSPLAPGPIGPIVLACFCWSFINKMSKVYPGLHFAKFSTWNSIPVCSKLGKNEVAQ